MTHMHKTNLQTLELLTRYGDFMFVCFCLHGSFFALIGVICLRLFLDDRANKGRLTVGHDVGSCNFNTNVKYTVIMKIEIVCACFVTNASD